LEPDAFSTFAKPIDWRQPPSYRFLLVSHKPATPILQRFYGAARDEHGARSSWIVTIRTH
jgi:hypothetical protein